MDAGGRIGVGSFVVMRTLCVFDAVLLVLAGAILAWFMQPPPGLAAAGLCFVGAGMLIGLARWLDRAFNVAR